MLKNENNTPKGQLDSIDDLLLDSTFNYYALTRDYLYGMQNIMLSSPKYDRVVITKISEFDTANSDHQFKWNDIKQVCKEDTTDALIIINHSVLHDSMEVQRTSIDFIDDISYIWCFAIYKLVNKMSFVALDPDQKKIFINYEVLDSNSWKGDNYRCGDAINDLPDGGDMILQSCYETGQKAGRSISPTWQDNIRRLYYNIGNRFIRDGAAFAAANEWSKAGELWRRAAESKKRHVISKAAFNMALICEIEDRPDLAQSWIDISDTLKSTVYSRTYKQILQVRATQKKELDHQLEISDE